MKHTFLFALVAISGISLASCGTYRYESARRVKVKGSPNTDFYVKNQKSYTSIDGFEREMNASHDVSIVCNRNFKYVGSTDDTGMGVLEIGTKSYKQSRGIIGLKSGYEPTNFKLKKTFNVSTLLNLLFPPALFFDHYLVLSRKKVNRVELKNTVTTKAIDYFNQAGLEANPTIKLELYQKAAEQDYRNEGGIRALALKNMAILYADKGETHRAYLILKKVERMVDQSVGARELLTWLQSVVNHQNDVAADKRAKWENRFNTINSIAGGLQTLGTSMNSSSSYSDAVRPSPSPASASGNYQTQYNEWARKAEAHYNSLTNLGVSVNNRKTGKKSGSAAQGMNSGNYTMMKKSLREAQQQMKNIRLKAQKAGIVIQQSSWETATVSY